jgi:hypothetical protein
MANAEQRANRRVRTLERRTLARMAATLRLHPAEPICPLMFTLFRSELSILIAPLIGA